MPMHIQHTPRPYRAATALVNDPIASAQPVERSEPVQGSWPSIMADRGTGGRRASLESADA